MPDNNIEKNSILDRIEERGFKTPSAGMKVPDGYFDEFARRMADNLPYRPEAEEADYHPVETRPNIWARVRPFVYMAAMFAGIWLMLQMFAMMGGAGKPLPSMDSNPVIASAFNDDEFINQYLYDDLSNYDILDELTGNEICATN